MTLLIGETFGVFFFALLISNLVFVEWPDRGKIVYDARRTIQRLIARFGERFNTPGKNRPFRLDTSRQRSYFTLYAYDTIYRGFTGVETYLLLIPVTYPVLAALLITPSWTFAFS
jgi:hypothetical protein